MSNTTRVIIDSLDFVFISAVTAAVLLGTSAAYAAVHPVAGHSGDGPGIELIEDQPPGDLHAGAGFTQASDVGAENGTWDLAYALVTGRPATKPRNPNANPYLSPGTKRLGQSAR